ncbi:MAG: heme-binding protein [Thermoanaerobaculia bacterium]
MRADRHKPSAFLALRLLAVLGLAAAWAGSAEPPERAAGFDRGGRFDDGGPGGEGAGGRGEGGAQEEPPAGDPQEDPGGGAGEPPGDAAPGQPLSSPICPAAPAGPCADGAQPLTAAEVQGLASRAAAAFSDPGYTVAVVDRAGRVLALLRKNPASSAFDDEALGLARTAAFFSHNQAPLSSRTVRSLSGVHFPAGVARTASAALYGIENTNRGCDLAVTWNPGQCVPRATSVVHGGSCDAASAAACGTGPVTGKPDAFDTHGPAGPPNHKPATVAVNPGGVPIYRGDRLVGGIGVAGLPAAAAEFAAFSAVSSGFGPAPSTLKPRDAVFIDGIRLPFVQQTSRPPGTSSGAAPVLFQLGPAPGGCVPEGYLVGPTAGPGLSLAEVQGIVSAAEAAAGRIRGVIRLPLGSRARMAIAVADAQGEILALFRMPDSTVFSLDVAVAKARNVAYLSRVGLPPLPPGTAITNRTLGFGAQPLFPSGIDGSSSGPFFGLFQQDLANPCRLGGDPAGPYRNGLVFFAGSVPLYRGSTLVGGLGVSGDGIEQDDYVSFFGAQGFLPPEALRADRFKVGGVRLPFLKFPRNPEG